MKKNVLLSFLLTILFSIQTNGQTNETKDLLCSGKWHLEYMEMAGQKMVLKIDDQKNNWFIFHKDGKLEALEMGKHYFGTWELIEEKNILRTNDRDGVKDQKIIKIDSKIFVYSVFFNGINTTIGVKKME